MQKIKVIGKKYNPQRKIKVVAERYKKQEKIKITAYNNSILKKLVVDSYTDSPIEYINNAVRTISNLWAVCLTYDENLIDLNEIYNSFAENKLYDINYLLKVCVETGQNKLKTLKILHPTNIILQRAGYMLRLFNKNGIDTSKIKYTSHELYFALFWHSMCENKKFMKKNPYDINDVLIRNGNNVVNISMKFSDSQKNTILSKDSSYVLSAINDTLKDMGMLNTFIMIPISGNKYINIPYLSFSKLLKLKDISINIKIAEMEMNEVVCEFNEDTNDLIHLLYLIDDYNSIERFLYLSENANQLSYMYPAMFISETTVKYRIKNKVITSTYNEFMDKYFRFMED